ncbi:MAG: hypothetical protein L7F77_04805 [Candidatus Magnetominusculus sp. LBB02]|nr:hypothetical protein [Candidatus Magnetominusculus sp. LBB02]
MRYCENCHSALVLKREYFAGNLYTCSKCKAKYFIPIVYYFADDGKGHMGRKPVMRYMETA